MTISMEMLCMAKSQLRKSQSECSDSPYNIIIISCRCGVFLWKIDVGEMLGQNKNRVGAMGHQFVFNFICLFDITF